jgi:transcriptional regulator with XRE-family HTH domain
MSNDLQKWRSAKRPKVTQAALAKRLGIAQGPLSEIEAGKRGVSDELAARIFKETGVRIGALAAVRQRDVAAFLRIVEARSAA